MILLYTDHVNNQMIDRGVDKQLVEQAIKRGSKTKQGKEKIIATYRYIEVVYKHITPDVVLVITVKINK